MSLKGKPQAEAPPHGTHARYVSRYYRCHEPCCQDAQAQYMADYRIRRANNGGRPLGHSSAAIEGQTNRLPEFGGRMPRQTQPRNGD